MARGFPSLAGRFASRLLLAVSAVRELRARPALVAVVLALATASWLSASYVNGRIAARRWTLAGQPMPTAERSPLPFAQRWMLPYHNSPVASLLWVPFARFASPLGQPSSVATRWVVLAYYPVMVRQFRAATHAAPPRSAARRSSAQWVMYGYPVAVGVLAALVLLLILVGLLGWVRDRDKPVRLSDLPGYWRRHYWAMLALALIGVALAAVASLVLNRLAEAGRSGPSALSDVAETIQSFASLAVMPILGLLFMFAPFVIVVRGVGWWHGIIGGLRLWRSRWPAVVALFVLFRVGWEVIAVWSAATPWNRWGGVLTRAPWLSSPPALLAWSWVATMGAALLGLWAAYAFMEIARPPASATEEVVT
ncbi:MAG TPA: hypothetical protein VM221_03665 [Armatimonadota bacterium]|nr:hypothetical protein [Armatimonadota bacterium]